MHRFYGASTSILNTGRATIWSGSIITADLPFLSSAVSIQLVAGAADAHPAGANVRSVRVRGVDENYKPIVADVNLNGASAVAVPTLTWLAINSVNALTWGANKVAAGNVKVQKSDASEDYSWIPVGQNAWNAASFTAPAGCPCWIKYLDFGCNTPTVGFDAYLCGNWMPNSKELVGPMIEQHHWAMKGSGMQIAFPGRGFYIPPKGTVRLQAQGLAVSCAVSVSGEIDDGDMYGRDFAAADVTVS